MKPTTLDAIQPWASVSAANWARAANAVVLSDMSRCEPAGALSPDLKRGHWKVIPYEAGGIGGNLIWACADADAPEMQLPLGATGWHAIFVGLYEASLAKCQAWLKLDSDAAPVPRETGKAPTYWSMQEIFFKVADIKPGERLRIRPMAYAAGPSKGCSLAYVKLIPLSPAEIAGYQADRGDASRRRLIATCDGSSFLTVRRPTLEELLAEVELYRDTDFGTLILHTGGSDQVCYPSRHGSLLAAGNESFPDPGYANAAQAIRELARQGINPTQTLIRAAHDIGMTVHVGIRPALWTYYEPFTAYFESPFYRAHPQWRIIDRDGTPVARMSWAVPQVRQHLLDVLREAVAFGADGAHIVFNRGFPVTLFETPFCRLFQEQHGLDPRTLDEADPRIWKLRADIVTTFVRETRTMLDEEQVRRGDGKRLEISLSVLGNEYDNQQYGLDIRRLADERLVDEIYPSIHQWDFGATKQTWDLEFFIEACAHKSVRVSPMISTSAILVPNYYTWEKFLQFGLDFFEQGADGIMFWDPAVQLAQDPAPPFLWNVISRYGHIDELRARLKSEPPKPVLLPVRRIGDSRLDARFPIYWGG